MEYHYLIKMRKEVNDIEDQINDFDKMENINGQISQSVVYMTREDCLDASTTQRSADPEDTFYKDDSIVAKKEPAKSPKVQNISSETRNLLGEIERIKSIQLEREEENKKLAADIEDKNMAIRTLKDQLRQQERMMIRSEERKIESVQEVPNLAFYDLVINFDSLKQLTQGWKIEYSEEADSEKRYNENKERNCCVVAVLGNLNKGKTFVLQKLSKYDLPNGYSIPTKGLSIKYPHNQGKAVTVLDCAGFEMPVKLDNNLDDGVNTSNYSHSKDEFSISETARDRAHTEEFVQSFVLNQSNVQIVVVGILTFSDQKLINKLIATSADKSIFVVHNLATYVTRSQVRDYIDEVLATTSKVKKNRYIIFDNKNSCDKSNSSADEENNFYWQDEKYKNMVHLVMARDGSDAGYYYNRSTLKYIEQQITSFISQKKFDPIESLRTHIYKMSSTLFEETSKINELEEVKVKDRLIKVEYKFDKGKEISLKKCLVTELGLNVFHGSKFTPKYSQFKSQNEFIVKVDIPDMIYDPHTKYPIDTIPGFWIIFIRGEKYNDRTNQELIRRGEDSHDSRDYGRFEIEMVLPVNMFDFSTQVNNRSSYEAGVLMISFDLHSPNKVKSRKLFATKK